MLQVDVLYLEGGFSMTPRASARYPLVFFSSPILLIFLPFFRRVFFWEGSLLTFREAAP